MHFSNLDILEVDNLSNLQLLARQVVEGFITGIHKSPYHGFSVEFAEHRQYNKGESTRFIDWKVYARTEKLFTKRFEEETNLRSHILIDNSSSMYYPLAVDDKKKLNKISFSILASAALIRIFRKQRDAIGLTVFSDKIEEYLTAKSSATHQKLISLVLEKLWEEKTKKTKQTNKKTDISNTLHQISETIHKRSLVIIFSDMFEKAHKTDDMFSALQHLRHNKHEVILFHTIDSEFEENFNFKNKAYLFIDMESGKKIKLYPNEIKDEYRKAIKDFEHKLKLRCAQYGIDYVKADINKDMYYVLSQYLIKRAKLF